MAIGRSKRPPSLSKSAGDKLTVIRPAGNSNPALSSAERKRSLAFPHHGLGQSHQDEHRQSRT
jgi:hypothetical protein